MCQWRAFADLENITKYFVYPNFKRLLPRGVDVPTQLHYLSERAFTAEKGGRQDSAKVAVVIVDGPIRDMASVCINTLPVSL